MKPYQANLLNSLTLILMCLWAYLTYEPVDGKSQNITALIPLILGGILLLCHKGIKNNNKINTFFIPASINLNNLEIR